MKQILKKYYFLINRKYPSIGIVIKRFIKYKKFFNSINKSIAGKANTVHYKGAIMNNISIDIIGSNNIIKIGTFSILNNMTFFIRGNNHIISIGKNCIFSRGGVFWMEHERGKLDIGDNTTMEDVHIAVTENNSRVSIGEDCMFAYDIDIRTGDSHSIIDIRSGQRVNKAKDVLIGNHIWVAAHCTILKGVTIPNDCVVATGSIVTKSIQECNVILAGTPAKIVKKNIVWDRRNLL